MQNSMAEIQNGYFRKAMFSVEKDGFPLSRE
jgi:hypothetical protein